MYTYGILLPGQLRAMDIISATTVNIDDITDVTTGIIADDISEVVTCGEGYVGTPSITLCAENNTDLQVSGCFTPLDETYVADAQSAVSAAKTIRSYGGS